jgi:hypothetical protein
MAVKNPKAVITSLAPIVEDSGASKKTFGLTVIS